jgi:hypothetical protein
MIVSLALIWLCYKLNTVIPLLFLSVTWIPDVVLIFFIYGLIVQLMEKLGKKR